MQFPDVSAGGRRNVSTHGGTEPAWSPRGGELFFRDASGNMVSVEVKTAPSFSFGAPKVLFPATAYATYGTDTVRRLARRPAISDGPEDWRRAVISTGAREALADGIQGEERGEMSQQTDRLNAALAGRYRIERHLGVVA